MKVIEIKGDSMNPLLRSGQLVLVKAKSRSFKRGKIVTFQFKKDLLVKRVIGLPGETVKYKDGIITINNIQLKEPYIRQAKAGCGKYFWKLKEHEYILLGDNGLDSLDSRKLGPISENKMKHVLLLRLWPLGKLK